jgi:two-component system CheB/CheR fusion protein
VLSLFEVTDLKTHQRELEEARRYAEAIIETIHDPLLVLDRELRVNTANRAFCRMFDVTEEQTAGVYLYELGNKQWDIPPLREALGQVLSDGGQITGYHVTHEFPTIGRRTMRLNARKLAGNDHRAPMILLAFEDVTDREEANHRDA